MFGFFAPRQRAGSPPNARAINRTAREVERQSKARPGGALGSIEANGARFDYTTGKRTWLIRITSVGSGSQLGSYGWQAIYGVAATPGTYADLAGWAGELGGDAFWEDNGFASLAIGDKVEVYREYYSGQLRGQLEVCSS